MQLSFDYEGDELIRHRLAYVPCPYTLERLDFTDSLFEMLELSDALRPDEIRLAAPIRFDFDSHAARADHSASHFTLLSPEARIPAIGPLSLGHFVRFIFRHFYPSEWHEFPFLEWPVDYGHRTIDAADTLQVHMGWTSQIGQGLTAVG